MNTVKQWATSVLFPNRCYICGTPLSWQNNLCAACRDEVPYILPPICPSCGRSKDECLCRRHTRLYERSVSPIYYNEQTKRAIYQLKNFGYRQIVDALAAEMAELVRREYGGIAFDAIVPVPLYKTSYAERGFNQSALLAQALAPYVGADYQPILVKLYSTKPQKKLSLAHRSGNLLGAFDVVADTSIKDAVILLVDDIITTGSTLNECAKMLKLYGAREVYVVTAAATPLKTGLHDIAKMKENENECWY